MAAKLIDAKFAMAWLMVCAISRELHASGHISGHAFTLDTKMSINKLKKESNPEKKSLFDACSLQSGVLFFTEDTKSTLTHVNYGRVLPKKSKSRFIERCPVLTVKTHGPAPVRLTSTSILQAKMEVAGPYIVGTGAKFKGLPYQKGRIQTWTPGPWTTPLDLIHGPLHGPGIYRNSLQGWPTLLTRCMHNLSPVILDFNFTTQTNAIH